MSENKEVEEMTKEIQDAVDGCANYYWAKLIAAHLYEQDYRNVKDKVVLDREEYERLKSVEITLEEFTKDDVVVLSKEKYEVLKIKEKEKHWLETCMSVWKNAKIDSSQETAKEILQRGKLCMPSGLREWIEKQYEVEVE